MEGGHIVIGIEDKTLKIVGIQNLHTITLKILNLLL
jgi:predicted HTH transcriptional regulator